MEHFQNVKNGILKLCIFNNGQKKVNKNIGK